MAAAVLLVADLPGDPLDAAAFFHGNIVVRIRKDFGDLADLTLAVVFDPAGHEHRGWRLAAIQALAREMAPGRVNGIVGRDEVAVREAIDFLEQARGVTGQLLEVAGHGTQNL